MPAMQKQDLRFAFVPVNDVGKPKKGTDRKIVRSHCMRGRNRRIGVPGVPSRNPAPVHQDTTFLPSSTLPSCNDSLRHDVTVTSTAKMNSENGTNQETVEADRNMLPPSYSELSLVKFALDIDNRYKELILHYMFTDSRLVLEPYIKAYIN